MILYLPGNVLKAARILDLGACHFCPASTEEMASIEMSEDSVKLLYAAEVEFVIELERNELPPVFVNLKPHRLNATVGVAWFVPQYFKYPKPRYDVEAASKIEGNPNQYLSNLTEKQIDELVPRVKKILRIYSVHGLTPTFLEKFNLRVITKGKLAYAVPNRKQG